MCDLAPVAAEDVPEDEADALLEKLADGIVGRRLAVPAVLFMEAFKPLNFLGSQLMMAFHPMVASIVKGDDYRKVALLMEEDSVVEELLQRVERKEAQAKAHQLEQKLAEGTSRGAGGPIARLWARARGRSNRGQGDADE